LRNDKVILNKKTYRTIVAASVRYANARIPEQDWSEIYGILIGHIDKKKNVVISQAHPITHTMKKGHILKVSYDDPDYIDAALIEEEAFTHDPPEFIVGWFHSHPGIKVMFTQDDVKNQLGFQTNNPQAIGLVFNHVRLMRQVELARRRGDPSQNLENDPGFKIFRLSDPSRGIEASYDEVDFEFTDAILEPSFIEEAKEFVGDATKLLVKDNMYGTTKTNMDKQFEKIREVYSGTEAYIKTLIKKGETSRIEGVIETQKTEIQKLMGIAQEDILKLQELTDYVEYKEKEDTTRKMNGLFEDWQNNVNSVINSFNNLNKRF
jgi:proteasome lid subunit RPN8/RPN11